MRELSRAGADPHESTSLQLGGPVRCSDGPAGILSDVVVDPKQRRVSHLVVESPNGGARLVPAELVVPVLPGFGPAELGGFGTDLWTGYAVTYDRIPPGSAVLRHPHPGPKETGDPPIDSVAAIDTDRITVAP